MFALPTHKGRRHQRAKDCVLRGFSLHFFRNYLLRDMIPNEDTRKQLLKNEILIFTKPVTRSAVRTFIRCLIKLFRCLIHAMEAPGSGRVLQVVPQECA